MRRAGLFSRAMTAALAAACWSGAHAAAPVVESAPAPRAAEASLDARVARIERVLEGQALMNMLSRLDQLQQDVQRLRGELEVLSHNVDGMTQRQRDLYLDIDQRLRQIETAVPAHSAAPDLDVPVPPPLAGGTHDASAPAAPDRANAASEAELYQRSIDHLKEGRYDEAVAGFNGLLAEYPHGEYAANAQYWLGEAQYVMRRFTEAAEAFNKVLANHPSSSKVADSLLKLGFSYYELGDWTKARASLERVIAQNPQSTAAQLADKRLAKMKAEGR